MKGSGRGVWALKRARSLWVRSRKPATQHARWGWKEPNTYLFLSHLSASIADLRYIHILRDGLVMAESRNWDQAAMWGSRYGLDSGASARRPPTPRVKLEYWIRANREAIETGQNLHSNRFLLLSYDKVLDDPHDMLMSLADWAGLDWNEEARLVASSVKKRAVLASLPSNDLIPRLSSRDLEGYRELQRHIH